MAESAANNFAALDDETHYDVTLKSAFKYAGAWVRPSSARINLKGKVIKANAEHVDGVHALTN